MLRVLRHLQILLLIIANFAVGCSAPQWPDLDEQAVQASAQQTSSDTDSTHGEPSDAEGESERETDWLPDLRVDSVFILAPDSSQFSMSHKLPPHGRDMTRALFRPPRS